ncbi:chemotaxis protein CheD [Halanaerobacter jeridensis]|uniref:Probable chemoreceptor glutamine deamidase CheD n=1 Tax=Halanaerobacter jeridensis TaxID=706427 RepID=A0A939BRF0_9FIRM|nr:chemotaxis protein CheD [Halanaerobacter jeridensis]MBM7555921.1 chemotaxis protein CheD [Halanaerobacter jeridensis]
MKKTFSHKFNKRVVEIFAGEYYTTDQSNVILSTLLGSCVAVCMVDQYHGIAGINHIMISKSADPKQMLLSQDSRYGIHAMELLINNMLKKGASRRELKAKVFGGGKVLNNNETDIAYANVDFAVSYLENEGIPILARDTGGHGGRKIFFFPKDFSVYLRRINMKSALEKTKEQERKHFNQQKKEDKAGELTLFE